MAEVTRRIIYAPADTQCSTSGCHELAVSSVTLEGDDTTLRYWACETHIDLLRTVIADALNEP